MPLIAVGRRSLSQRSIAARVNFDSGCPICSSVLFLYDFTAGRKRVSQCAGCGLVRFNNRAGADATASSPVNGAPASAAPRESDISVVARALITYVSSVYAHREQLAGRQTQVLIVGSAAPTMTFDHFKAQSVSLPFAAGDVSAEGPDGVFDIAIIDPAIESVSEPLECLRQIRQLLRSDGLLVFRTERLGVDLASADGKLALDDAAGCFLYDFDQVRSLAFAAGFGATKLHPIKGSAVHPATYSRSLTGEVAVVAQVRAMASAVSGRQTLSIIMPAYNEKATFSKVFELVYAKRLEDLDKEIIIVESNSSDGTRDDVLAVQNLPGVRILLQDRPQGKGFAVRAGLAVATGDYVLIQDADLEYDVEDYDLLLEPLVSHRAAFVLGVRHGESGGGWKMRRFSDQRLVSHLMNLGQMFFTGMFNVIYGQRIADPFTMYKLFRRDCVVGLTFEANRFDFDWEIVGKLVRRGYRAVEIPVNYVSRSFADGKKVSFFRDPLTWIWACVKFRFVEIA